MKFYLGVTDNNWYNYLSNINPEILIQPPKSGDYPEKHFGQTFNSQLWVKFMDNNLQEWVGCFP